MKENIELAKTLCRHFLKTELVKNIDSEDPEVDFKTENDFQITFLEAFLGLMRLLPRALMHKSKISWF